MFACRSFHCSSAKHILCRQAFKSLTSQPVVLNMGLASCRLGKPDLERTPSLPSEQAVLEAMKRFEELSNVPVATSVLPVTERLLQVCLGLVIGLTFRKSRLLWSLQRHSEDMHRIFADCHLKQLLFENLKCIVMPVILCTQHMLWLQKRS